MISWELNSMEPGKSEIWVVVLNIIYFYAYLGKWSDLTSIFFKWVETTN